MENKNDIKEEALDHVSGGSAHLLALKEEVLASLPADVKEKLDSAPSDAQVCKVLAESGIDVEALENKIKKGGFNLNKIGLQLSDQELSQASGGSTFLSLMISVCR